MMLSDICATGSCFSPSCITGKERDAESGNDYFGARYYASTIGRFMSPDWSAKTEPVPYAKLDNPQTLNLYAYVGNNPLSRIDADGHIQRDKDGNVIFEATSKSQYQTWQKIPAKDGSSLEIGWKQQGGYVLADDGTKIAASKATGPIEVTMTDAKGTVTKGGAELLGESNVHSGGNSADCHGTTFASGQVWIGNDQVKALMDGDHYHPITGRGPQAGDVGIYSTDGTLANAQHSVRVLTGATESPIVRSKGGITDPTAATSQTGWSGPRDVINYYSQQ